MYILIKEMNKIKNVIKLIKYVEIKNKVNIQLI